VEFEWDTVKAAENVKNHKVSFEEGRTVFLDPLAQTLPDPDHSEGEERWIEISYSTSNRLLVVNFTERQGTIRLISCRTAERRERRKYEEG
jgi:uncharacterized protein